MVGATLCTIAVLCVIGVPDRQRALVVADEFPAMRVLAATLRAEARTDAELVTQQQMPEDLTPYSCVIVYIHGRLDTKAEDAFIRYAEGGGKLILLHHTISSGKRANPHWFRFLGVDLPAKPFAEGGYRWTEGVEMDIRALAPRHALLKGVPWGAQQEGTPGFHLAETEVYLNHVLLPPLNSDGMPGGKRTLLLGLSFTDKDGKTYRQDTAGWAMRAGKGHVLYFMPGHSELEFRHPAYARILVHAVTWRP